MAEAGVMDRPHLIYNVDETGCVLNNRQTQKIVARTGSKVVIKQTSVERGELVTVVACCYACGHYIPPFVIFKGKKFHKEWEDGFPLESKIFMSDSGWINEDLFLEWLKHFQANRIPGRCILVLDGHASHKTLPVLLFCEKNEITLLSLPSHTTQRLQPLDRSFFKPLKTYYDIETNAYMTACKGDRKITKFNFGRLFRNAWSKAATIGNAENGFRSTGIFPLNPGVLTELDLHPSNLGSSHAPQGASTPFSKNPSSDQKLTASPFEESQSSTSTSEESSNTLGRSFHNLLPTPEKIMKVNVKKSRKQTAQILTSPDIIEETKQRLKKQNIRNMKGTCRNLYESSSDRDGNIENGEISSDDTLCGFCSKSYNCANSSKFRDWIKCMECNYWYHELCVGAKGLHKFTCGKCA